MIAAVSTVFGSGGDMRVLSCRQRLGAVLAVAAVALAPAPAAGAEDADEFLIVDCLLPGQIRRLGRDVTYVAPRKAVKTSASDCGIRGGEYVAYDRTNYATALKVWLPFAEDGDAEAMVYVGEIFEKGLGLPSDPETAALWYRAAAEAGSRRAAVNLGSLYEQGRGVPADPEEALRWYRVAAGVPGLTFSVGPDAATATPQAEIKSLRRELDSKQREIERLQGEMDALRRELEQRRSDADTEQGGFERPRRELAQMPWAAEEAKFRGVLVRVAAAGAAGASEGRAMVEALEAAIAALGAELEDLRARLAERDSEIERLRGSLAELETRLVEQAAPADARPLIELIEPELASTRGAPQVTLRSPQRQITVIGRVNAPERLFSLTVNGEAAPLDGGLFRAEVPLAGADDEVRIVGVDTAGERSTIAFAVVSARAATTVATAVGEDGEGLGLRVDAAAIEFGTYHALVIGNDDYRLFPPLKTASADARSVAETLERHYGFEVTLLVDATRYDVLSALNELRKRLSDEDNLLIYYAGHGELDRVNQRGHWLPVDAEPDSTANWVSNVAITDILNATSVRQLLVVADSCYSGTLTRAAVGRLEAGRSEAARLELIASMVEQRSRMVLTSGGLEPVLDAAGGEHSIFADALINALERNVGVLAGQELFTYVLPRVVAAAERTSFRQVPEYAPIKYAGHESGDFFFVRRSL